MRKPFLYDIFIKYIKNPFCVRRTDFLLLASETTGYAGGGIP